MALSQLLALSCALVGCVLAHQYYQDRIPNGYSVPNPCGGGTWSAVGHFDAIHHTHDKNAFGRDFSAAGHQWTVALCQKDSDGDGTRYLEDFAAAGHQWTVALCQKDSDGDGKTNGEELGDPMCTWTPGSTPSGSATGQPGICEPVGSGVCAAVAFSCGCHGHNCVGK